jgi:HEAT repeat protein
MKLKILLCLALVLNGGLFDVQANDAVSKASSAQMVDDFKNSRIFWQQFQIASDIVALGNTNVLQELKSCLTDDDRHVRGNAAFIFARLGDERGFEVIREILTDRSERQNGQGVPGLNWPLQAQIASDRYYAVHLFGNLKDPRAVPILIPLLSDKEVNDVVPWALGEIGDKRAIRPLIEALSDTNPSTCVVVIFALETLKAREALPRLQQLLNDNDRTDFGDLTTVADAADEAIIELKPPQDAIDRLDAYLTSSSGIWLNGFPSGIVPLPTSAAIPEVVSRIIPQTSFGSECVTNYQIVESRQVNIPEASIPQHYIMVLVTTNLGKKIVVMRYLSDAKGWWHRIYDANGPPYLRSY